MYYSKSIFQKDIVETLRMKDSIKECALQLRKDCNEMNFNIDNSYCDINDMRISYEQFQKCIPKSWQVFFKHFSGKLKMQSNNCQIRCYMILQMFYYIAHNGSKKTPFHVAISQAIHTITKS